MPRRGTLTIYNYHRLYEGPGLSTLFDDAVFTTTAKAFESDIKRLKLDTDILSESEILEVVANPRTMPRHASAVTFDDGYRDNYEIAFPLLKAHGVPAIFFVPTLAIEERRLGWWDLIAYRLKQQGAEAGEIREAQARIKAGQRFEEGSEPPFRRQSAELMTWTQIRELARPPYAVGSHTHTHSILSSLAFEAQREELARSKQILERRLKKKVRSIAYPVGEYAHFTPETKVLARVCGYRLGFSFLTGENDGRALDAWDLRRKAPPVRHWAVARARVIAKSLLWMRAPHALGPMRRDPSAS